ncbi:MAG: DUF4358 domain-containing protein [Oscillospiraceae bacterium]|nr:DUF4358 domain-containing protein [Oscillospiraceae bacterium]
MNLAAFYATLFTDPENTPAVMDMTEMPDAMEAYYSGLSDIETKQCIIYMPMITAVAFEIALIEVANASDVKTVKAILQARIDNEINNNFNYPFVTENWTNNSRIVSNGNYIMMVAHEDCNSFVDSFNALF